MRSTSSTNNITPSYCTYGGRDAYTAAYATLDTLIDVTGFLGNLLVLISVLKFHWLRSTTNMFVASLAASDMLVCLNIPYYATFYFDLPYVCQKYPCLIRYAAMLYSEVVSVLSLVFVALDRYLAIVHALHYCRLAAFHGRVVTTCIGAIYVYVGIIVAPLFATNTWTPDIPECDLVFVVSLGYALLVVVLHVLLGLLLNVGLYACIFRVAWRQQRLMVTTLQMTRPQIPPDGGLGNTDQDNTRHHGLRHETRTAMTMVVVLAVHIFTLCPFLIVILLQYFDRKDQLPLSKAKKFVMCLYFAKSSINPLIYSWKTKDFRKAFKKLLRTDEWTMKPSWLAPK